MFVHSTCCNRLRLVWITVCTSAWTQKYRSITFRYLFRKHTAWLTFSSAPWIIAYTLNGQTFWDGDHHGKFVRFVRNKIVILRRRIKFWKQLCSSCTGSIVHETVHLSPSWVLFSPSSIPLVACVNKFPHHKRLLSHLCVSPFGMHSIRTSLKSE
jgi:hypothetical protein